MSTSGGNAFRRPIIYTYICSLEKFCNSNIELQIHVLSSKPTVATSQMISTESFTFTSGLNYVHLTWTRPKYLPEIYELKHVCITEPKCRHDDNSTDFIKASVKYLSCDSGSFRLSDLCPSTKCVLNLVAVYNAAGIDSGIVITVRTLAETKSKWNSGLPGSIMCVLYFIYSYFH